MLFHIFFVILSEKRKEMTQTIRHRETGCPARINCRKGIVAFREESANRIACKRGTGGRFCKKPNYNRQKI